jgi:hypothetical protein
MTDYLFPPAARISGSQWNHAANTAASRSIFNGSVQTLGRGGDRWQVGVSVQNSHDTKISSTFRERAVLKSLRAILRGQANRCYLADTGYQIGGSFPTSEILTNNTFASDTTGWSTSALFSLSAVDRVLTAIRASLPSPQVSGTIATNTSAATGVANFPYVARAFVVNGKGTHANYGLAIGSSSGGTQYVNATGFTAGMMTTSAVPTGTSLFIRLSDQQTSGALVDDTLHVLYLSLSRCALVKGASQTGAGLVIDGLPTSTEGLLLPGDRVQIGNQLNVVWAPLNSNSSGEGHLMCTASWRASPSDNAPVIIHNPMGRFVLTDNVGGWNDRPGRWSDFEFNFEEALDA